MTSATSSSRQLGLPNLVASPANHDEPSSAVFILGCRRCGFRIFAGLDDVVARWCPMQRQRSRLSSVLERLPRVPVRHWVLRPAPRSATLDTVLLRGAIAELFGTMRSLVATQYGVAEDGRCGAVCVLHPVNAALEPDPHIHALVLDGVYRWHRDAVAFFPLRGEPDPAALENLARRLEPLGGRPRSRRNPSDSPARRATGDPRRIRDLRCTAESTDPRRKRGLEARHGPVRVYAAPALAAADREGVARVGQYLARRVPEPARFTTAADGSIRYRLSRPFADGTTHVVFDAEQLSARLLALLPRDGPAVSVYGVLARGAPERTSIVPGQIAMFGRELAPSLAGGSSDGNRSTRASPPSPRDAKGVGDPRKRGDRCDRCGGHMHLLRRADREHSAIPRPDAALRGD